MARLDDALGAQSKVRKGPPCSVGLLLAALDDEERVAVIAALADKTRSKRHLSEAIRVAYKYEVQDHTLNRHRRGQCKCPR
jgi:hypothetical protein